RVLLRGRKTVCRGSAGIRENCIAEKLLPPAWHTLRKNADGTGRRQYPYRIIQTCFRAAACAAAFFLKKTGLSTFRGEE
ncbi:MAG TPA: hypothetical protein DEP61_01420, partial [Lachnospiraceae bacterium]|nr:hypothetical protein [Lachnospiraceae bacterium]